MRVRGLTAALATVLTVAATTGCDPQESSAAAAAEGPHRTLVVDTDLAADDLVALAFLLSSPRAEVRAITVSGTGEVRCPAGLEVIRGLLALTDDADIPVACGRRTPLAGDHSFPTGWRDSADAGWGLDLPTVQTPAETMTATQLLARTLSDGKATLLALGPLTNVAATFRARPRLSQQVPSVVVMGGALDVGGNVLVEGAGAPLLAEWNFYVDPTAAAEVIDSGVPVTLVGLDATNRVPITENFVAELRDAAGSEAGEIAAELLSGNPMVASGEAAFWDPLAAAVVLDPAMVDSELVRLSVVTGDGEDSGRTVRDESGTPVTVATGADRQGLERLLLGTFG